MPGRAGVEVGDVVEWVEGGALAGARATVLAASPDGLPARIDVTKAPNRSQLGPRNPMAPEGWLPTGRPAARVDEPAQRPALRRLDAEVDAVCRAAR